MRARPIPTGTALLATTLLGVCALPATPTPHPSPTPERAPHRAEPARPPRLVVLLVVDQMRADYVDDYGARWSGGLHRLFEGGAVFRQAFYPYLVTVTCAGHATLGTGTLPHAHGMVLNKWFDRQTGRRRTCTEDATVRSIGYGREVPGGESAARLERPTLAEILHRPPTSGRVVSVSIKARSAIGMAGHAADAVVWFDRDVGAWSTSSYYSQQRVPFVEAFARLHPVDAQLGRRWDRLLPAADYSFEDDAVGERSEWHSGRTFPHRLEAAGAVADAHLYEAWGASPFSDEAVGELAIAAIDSLGLGRGGGTDFLGVSFSALDLVGHDFGPRSHEVQDVLARLDLVIGRLLDRLDAAVGPDGYVLALSADHGVAPIPEQEAAAGRPGGRVDGRAVMRALEGTLAEAWGPGRHVVHVEYTDVYLEPGGAERLAGDPALRARLREAVRQVPGVADLLGCDVLDDAGAATGRARAAALSHDHGRSGDLVLLPEPYWIATTDATTHGTDADYDRHVPLVLYGPAFRPGTFDAPASPADAAPTLARVVGVSLPDTEGRILAEALR